MRSARIVAAGTSLALLASASFARGDDPPAEPPPIPPPVPAVPPAEDPPEEPDPVEVTIREAPRPVDATTMTRAETRSLPGAFGDPFRAIESVPSVVPLASGIPYFYVRGAPPGNIGYFLDGIRVPLLFHLGLGPSVIHPALVDRVEVSPGSNPELGRFAGGVVSGTLTQQRETFRVEGNLRAVDTGAFIEIPFDDARGSVLAAGRFSYTALLFSLLNSSTILDYWDYAGRATYEIAKGQRLGIFGFGAYDHLAEKTLDPEEPEQLLVDTMFHRLDVFYDVVLGPRTKMRYDVVLGWDQTRLDEEREVIDRLLTAKSTLTSRVDDDLEVVAGFDVTLDDYEVDLSRGGSAAFPDFFTSRLDIASGLYVVLPWNVGDRLALRPGLRGDFFVSGPESTFALDPSISARLAIIPSLALVTSHGLASQMPSFIVAGPGFRPGLDKGGLQRAFSSSAGVEWKPDEDWMVKVNGYRSVFIDFNDALGSSEVADEGFPDGLDDFDQRFSGTAVGLELSLKRRLSRSVGAIVTYSLGRSTRTDEKGRTFPSTFDRTHVATAAVTYEFGHGFRGSVRQIFYTGAPHLEVLQDEVLLKKRFPPFYRLDTRFEKRWNLGKTGFISVVVEVLNTFLAQEVLGEECETVAEVPDDPTQPATLRQRCHPSKIGPVTIPSLGVEGGY